MKAPLGGFERLVGAVEPLLLDTLVAEGLHRADTAETGLDLGIDGAGLLLGRHRGAAHPAPQQHQHHQKHRNDGHDDNGHAPLDAEHHRQRAHDGDDGDGQILRPVVGQLRQLEQVGGQAAHQLSRAVAVIEIEAQRLHMMEQVAADIRLHTNAEGVAPVGDDVVQSCPQHKGQRHHRHDDKEHPVVLLRQPVVQRRAGDQRKGQIHHGNQNGAADIQRKQLPVGLEVAQEDPRRTAGTVILRGHISIPFPKIILQFRLYHRAQGLTRRVKEIKKRGLVKSLPCVRGGGTAQAVTEGLSAVKTISQSRIRPTAPFTQGSLSCYAVRKPMPQTKEKQRHSRCFSGVVCRSVVS